MNCDTCSDSISDKFGYTKCTSCQTIICSCCLHQRVGYIKDKKCNDGAQFGEEPCGGIMKFYGLDKWCRCCPINIDGFKVKYV